MRYSLPAGNGSKYGIGVKDSMIPAKTVVLVLRYDIVSAQNMNYYYELSDNLRMFKAGTIFNLAGQPCYQSNVCTGYK
jgi:hypothetical protein